jgi:hypothetical protein
MIKIDFTPTTFLSTSQMQRQIVDGVPYFIDKQNAVYLWDTETSTPARIGSYNSTTKSLQLEPNLTSKFHGKLELWRAIQQSRPRRPAGTEKTSKRGRNAGKNEADESEGSDSDAS